MSKFKVRYMNNKWVIVNFLKNSDIHFLSNIGSIRVMVGGDSSIPLGDEYFWPTMADANVYLTNYLKTETNSND